MEGWEFLKSPKFGMVKSERLKGRWKLVNGHVSLLIESYFKVQSGNY